MEKETEFNIQDAFGMWVCNVCRDLVDDPKSHWCPPRLVVGPSRKIKPRNTKTKVKP